MNAFDLLAIQPLDPLAGVGFNPGYRLNYFPNHYGDLVERPSGVVRLDSDRLAERRELIVSGRCSFYTVCILCEVGGRRALYLTTIDGLRNHSTSEPRKVFIGDAGPWKEWKVVQDKSSEIVFRYHPSAAHEVKRIEKYQAGDPHRSHKQFLWSGARWVGRRVAKPKRGKCYTPFCSRPTSRPQAVDRCSRCSMRLFRLNHPERATFSALRDNARRRGIDFSLTLDEWIRFCRESDYVERRGRNYKYSITVDRIDPGKGYAAGNIQALSQSENSTKGRRRSWMENKGPIEPDEWSW